MKPSYNFSYFINRKMFFLVVSLFVLFPFSHGYAGVIPGNGSIIPIEKNTSYYKKESFHLMNEDKYSLVSFTSGENSFLSGATFLALADSNTGTNVQLKPWDFESNISIFKGNLIGWLFFEQPYEGVGVYDIILFALIGVLFLKIVKMSSTKGNSQGRGNSDLSSYSPRSKDSNNADYQDGTLYRQNNYESENADRDELRRRASNAWDALRSKPARQENQALASETPYGSNIPKDFDTGEFLKGAKILYSRVQYSWAARDLKDLEPFTTKEMMDALREQAEKDPTPTLIEVLLVNASLASVEREGNEESAKVLFMALLQSEKEGTPFEVKELWSFTHSYDEDILWRLDAIETVE